MVTGYFLIAIMKISYSVKPLDNIFFLISFTFPISQNVVFYITLKSILWRLKSVQQISERKLSADELRIIYKFLDHLNEIFVKVNRYYSFNIVLTFFDIWSICVNATYLFYDVTIHSLPFINYVLVFGAYMYNFTAGYVCFLIIFTASHIDDNYANILINLNFSALREEKRKTFKFYQL